MKPPIPTGSRYVALGSSFAAGPGIPPRASGTPFRARRSARNYPHLVAGALGLDLADVSYSGATTSDVLQPSPIGAPAQLDAITSETRLVTITVGGNDVGYLGRLTLASLPWPLRALPSVKANIARSGDPAVMDEGFKRLEENLVEVGRLIHERAAPECRVLFVDYLTILPADDAERDGPPPADIAAWGRAIATRLSATTQAAAGETDSEFVAAGAASAEHHAWSAVPWTRRFGVSLRSWAPFHPNAAGMAAVADLVLAALTS